VRSLKRSPDGLPLLSVEGDIERLKRGRSERCQLCDLAVQQGGEKGRWTMRRRAGGRMQLASFCQSSLSSKGEQFLAARGLDRREKFLPPAGWPVRDRRVVGNRERR